MDQEARQLAKAEAKRAEAAKRLNDLTRFGENVREARDGHELTQEELAHKSGLSVVQISRIERGRREIRLSTLLKLVEALETTPDRLLHRLFTTTATHDGA